MEYTKVKKINEIYKIKHYNGSLDFPCDFCNSNSYDNYHILKGYDVQIVVCQKCLNKLRDK